MVLYSYIAYLFFYLCFLFVEYLACWLLSKVNPQKIKEGCEFFGNRVIWFHIISTIITLMTVAAIVFVTDIRLIYGQIEGGLYFDAKSNTYTAEAPVTLAQQIGWILLYATFIIQIVVQVLVGVQLALQKKSATMTIAIFVQTFISAGMFVLFLRKYATDMRWLQEKDCNGWRC